MLKKIVIGTAAVLLSFGLAVPVSAQAAATDSKAVALTPGIFCIWFGWC